MKLHKFDYLNLAGGALAVVGLILAVIGCAVLSVPEGIGMNLDLSPLVYVGVALIAAGLAASSVGNAFYKRCDMNRAIASAALYAAAIALMVVVVLIACTIFRPVINPSNGGCLYGRILKNQRGQARRACFLLVCARLCRKSR